MRPEQSIAGDAFPATNWSFFFLSRLWINELKLDGDGSDVRRTRDVRFIGQGGRNRREETVAECSDRWSGEDERGAVAAASSGARVFYSYFFGRKKNGEWDWRKKKYPRVVESDGGPLEEMPRFFFL